MNKLVESKKKKNEEMLSKFNEKSFYYGLLQIDIK